MFFFAVFLVGFFLAAVRLDFVCFFLVLFLAAISEVYHRTMRGGDPQPEPGELGPGPCLAATKDSR